MHYIADTQSMLDALTGQGGVCGDWGDVMKHLRDNAMKDEDNIIKGI